MVRSWFAAFGKYFLGYFPSKYGVMLNSYKVVSIWVFWHISQSINWHNFPKMLFIAKKNFSLPEAEIVPLRVLSLYKNYNSSNTKLIYILLAFKVGRPLVPLPDFWASLANVITLTKEPLLLDKFLLSRLLTISTFSCSGHTTVLKNQSETFAKNDRIAVNSPLALRKRHQKGHISIHTIAIQEERLKVFVAFWTY